jgi:transposase
MPQKTYAHLKNLEPEIVKMREEGLSKREIAEYFSLTKEQVKELLKRYRRRERKLITGSEPCSQGRPRKDGQLPNQDIQREVERLRMENKLLRDFLQSAERM